MNRLQLVRSTGALLLGWAIAVNIPYALLSQTFEYDDILRQPTAYVLTQFHAGGTGLILTWLAFALLALLFVPAIAALHRVLERENTPYLLAATLMGALSGVVQAIGLMRWVFVVPVLANAYVDPATDSASRAAIAVVYQALHQYGGVAIGEQIGQLLLVGWTLGLGIAMLHSPLVKPWIGWFGLATIPFWLLGQSELLATVMPIAAWEVTPIGFMLWEVWLAIVGVRLLKVSRKRIAEAVSLSEG